MEDVTIVTSRACPVGHSTPYAPASSRYACRPGVLASPTSHSGGSASRTSLGSISRQLISDSPSLCRSRSPSMRAR